MKSYVSISILFVLLSSFFTTSLKAYNSLTVQDPRATWRYGVGPMDSVTLVVKPKGLFLEHSIYINFSAKNLNYTSKDTLEVIFNFDLPSNAIVTDSWLWLTPSQILKGKLLDLWTASTIYENIVKRRRDPSILKKLTATQYELRIFPMAGNAYRKVKITYLVPLDLNGNILSGPIATNYLNTSKIPINNINFIYLPETKYGNPILKTNSGTEITFWEKEDPEFGKFLYKPITLNDITKTPILQFTLDRSYTSYFTTFEKDNENYYQLAVQLSSLVQAAKDKKILITFDYYQSNTFSKDVILDELQSALIKNLSPTQSFNMCYVSGFDVVFNSMDWMSATPENIITQINKLRNNASNVGSTLSLLAKSLQYIKSKNNDGSIYFLSAGDMYSNIDLSNSILQDLTKEGLASTTIHISDICSLNKFCGYINNILYCNNHYLYTNISRISKGSYTKYDTQNSSLSALFTSSISKTIGNILNLDFYSTVDNGFCYNKYINKDLNQYNLSDYVVQVGKFTGSLPFRGEVSGFLDNKIFNSKFTIPIENRLPTDATNVQIWAGNYIKELEKNISSNITVNNIINLSTEHNVLSLYTAFLCLEDTSYYCVNCKDETHINTGTEELKDSINFISFPNPFSEKIQFTLNDLKDIDPEQVSISIYDISGRKVDIISEFQLIQGSLKFSWQPFSKIQAGVYICILKANNSVYKKKIIKM